MYRSSLATLIGASFFLFSVGSGAVPQRSDGSLAATYFGGSGNERVVASAVDEDGNIYLIGNTDSPDLPVSPGAYDTEFNGGGDVFVAVFDKTLEHLLASSFLGGEGRDEAGAIAVDDSGYVFVSGHTDSPDFPVTAGAFDAEHNGSSDFFVTRFSPDLTTVLASTFIGGGAEDQSGKVTVSQDGESIYLVGWTRSSDCPILNSSSEQESQGDWDVYLARLSPDLASLQGATYFGGDGGDHSVDLHAAPNGDVYVAVTTNSQEWPGVSDAYSHTLAGFYDIAVARFDARLSALKRVTFFGGTSMDDGFFLTLDRTGNVIIGGHSNTPGCPTTPGAFDTEHNGSDEGFVSAFSGDLTRLLAATYLGGSSTDESVPAKAAATDRNGRVFVVGPVSDWRPTTPGALSGTVGGGSDVFLFVFDKDLQLPLYSTFIGGGGIDDPAVVEVGGDGRVYILGRTGSEDFPVSKGAFDGSLNGGEDAFILSFEPNLVG